MSEQARVGAVTRFEITGYTTAGSFFTGIGNGDAVVVTDHTVYAGSHSMSVTAAKPKEEQGARLSINGGHTLTPIAPVEWSYEQVKAGQRAAQKAVQTRLENACDRRAKGVTDKALEFLDGAEQARQDEFALGVLAEYIRDAHQGTIRYHY
jgi:hypothetical protein